MKYERIRNLREDKDWTQQDGLTGYLSIDGLTRPMKSASTTCLQRHSSN